MKQLLGALAAALALALAGCNGAEPDDPPEPPVTEASPDPTPTPEETFDPTEETAREFLERWFETSAEMQNTGEVDDYEAMFSPGCTGCEGLVEMVEGIYAEGGYIDVERPEMVEIERDTRDQWTVTIQATSTKYQRDANSPVETIDGGIASMVFFLEQVDGAWQVIDYFNREAPS